MGNDPSKPPNGTGVPRENSEDAECNTEKPLSADTSGMTSSNRYIIRPKDVPDKVITMNLPAKMFRHSAGVAFDIGGSRCKVAFAKRINADSCDSSNDEDQVCVTMAVFHREDISDAVTYVKNNITDGSSVYSLHCDEKRVIKTCGLSMGQDARDFIGRDLQSEVRRIDEFTLTVNGLKCLLSAIPDESIFYENSKIVAEKINRLSTGLMRMMMSLQPDVEVSPTPPETSPEPETETRKEIENALPTSVAVEDIPGIPYMVVNIGSGTSCMLVSPDGSNRYISGSPQGGTVLLSLAKLLVNTSDYKEVMDLAASGDETRVSTVSRDLRNNNTGEKDFYEFMPEEMVVFPLGKLLDGKSAGSRPEDLAIALVKYVIGMIALETFWVAVAHGCQAVYVAGGILEHRVAREAYEEWFQGTAIVSGRVNVQCRLVKLTSFLGVLGALADNQSN